MASHSMACAVYVKPKPVDVFGSDIPQGFRKDKKLQDIIDEIWELLRKDGKTLAELIKALERVVEFIPKVAAGDWLPTSLFGVKVGIMIGREIPAELLKLIAFAAACGLIIGGIAWWMKANKIDLVNDVVKPAYEAVQKRENDGVVAATVIGGSAGGALTVAASGPVGRGIVLGAAAGYGLFRGARALFSSS